MGAQRRQRVKPQHTGPHLRFSGCAGRCFARLSLLPFCQTASAFRLICLFHTFCRRGVYRAMVFAPLRCPKLFRFPFACLRAAPSVRFAHLFSTILIGTALLINAVSFLMIRKIVQIICITKVKQTMKNEVSKLEGH